jgi:thiol-disulfide isomerase/thioredoxin
MPSLRLPLLVLLLIVAAGGITAQRLPFTGPGPTRSGDGAGATATPAAMMPAPAWANRSWLNSAPLALGDLRGRVVLLNFWVFTCGNCTRTLPSLVRFDAVYRDRGLTLIGIHTPEFPPYAGEHDKGNVAAALRRHGVTYPIAQDNDRRTWDLYGIRYWPTFVLIDKQARIRHEGVGEFHVGDATHREWEQRIEALLAE